MERGKRPFAAGRKWRRRRCDSSWRAEEAEFVFPGPNRAVGARGLGPGRGLKGRGASMGEGEWGREAPGRSGRWADLWGWRAGVLGPGRGYDRDWCPPNPQRERPVTRHEAAAGAGVREGLHSARLQQWHPLQFQTSSPAELENRVRSRAPRTCARPGRRRGARLGGAGHRGPGPGLCQDGSGKQDPGSGAGGMRPSAGPGDLTMARAGIGTLPSSPPPPGLVTTVMRRLIPDPPGHHTSACCVSCISQPHHAKEITIIRVTGVRPLVLVYYSGAVLGTAGRPSRTLRNTSDAWRSGHGNNLRRRPSTGFFCCYRWEPTFCWPVGQNCHQNVGPLGGLARRKGCFSFLQT